MREKVKVVLMLEKPNEVMPIICKENEHIVCFFKEKVLYHNNVQMRVNPRGLGGGWAKTKWELLR